MTSIIDIYTAESDGKPMQPHERIEVVSGGLAGDRYLTGTGHYAPYDVCEVTFISAAAIDTISDRYGIDLTDGRHRRNIVLDGHNLRELLEVTFQLGDATFRGTRPRPPCAHVERVAGEDGLARAMSEGRGGICADVIEPGTIAVGDRLSIVEKDPRTVGQSIVDRLKDDTNESG
ncbi:MOSC domain-containing protein [Halorubraceae archaeon YAN]|nr:MOSC domain-containing protein [Halorubraceae archaeon YAN]